MTDAEIDRWAQRMRLTEAEREVLATWKAKPADERGPFPFIGAPRLSK